MPQQAEFGSMLDRLVHEHCGSAVDFCRRLIDQRVETDRTLDAVKMEVSRVMRGLAPPPMDKLDGWARALGLKGREAEDFRVQGELAQLPKDSATAKHLRSVIALTKRLTAENEQHIENVRKLKTLADQKDAIIAELRQVIATLGASDRPGRG